MPRRAGGEVRESSGLQIVARRIDADLGKRHASLEEAGMLEPRSPDRQIALSPRKVEPPGLCDELDGNVGMLLPEALALGEHAAAQPVDRGELDRSRILRLSNAVAWSAASTAASMRSA